LAFVLFRVPAQDCFSLCEARGWRISSVELVAGAGRLNSAKLAHEGFRRRIRGVAAPLRQAGEGATSFLVLAALSLVSLAASLLLGPSALKSQLE
jgi:hypothetical protein